MSVGKDNLINTKVEWDLFAKANAFFVLAATGSTCENCCTSEPILKDLQELIKDKNVISYPEKIKRKKKIVRKEIKIARIDLANDVLVQNLPFLSD